MMLAPRRLAFLVLATLTVSGSARSAAAGDAPAYQFSIGELGSGDGQLAAPRSVSIQGNELYVLEYGNKRVSVFDLDGNFLRSWGEAGAGKGQIYQPQHLLATPAGEVYITDFGHHDIQVFDGNGTYLRGWGGIGSADSLLYYPWGMDYDADGNVWVSDRQNQVIKKFTPQGVHLQTIGTPEVNGCTDLVVTADKIYGAMWSTQHYGVRTWDLAGNYLGQSVGTWDRSQGIDQAPNGDLYVVSESPAHRAYILDPVSLGLVADWGGYGLDPNQLAGPYDVAVSAAGAAYIPCDDEGVVKVFSYATSVEPSTWGRIKGAFREDGTGD